MNRLLTVAVGLSALFAAQCIRAQATLHTIISNGPPANRFTIAILSEGYTSGQLNQFRVDATNAVNAIMATQPYQEYRPYFNAFAIAVASTQSGSDHPAYSVSKNTYFNSSYDRYSDYLITIPPGSAGQGKVDALLQAYVPGCDLSILLVNDIVAGGSDGAAKTAICSTAGIPGILVHEIGHVVADLGDEYTQANPGYPDVEEPNTTRETNRTNIKWRAWILPDTPIPTPEESRFVHVVGLFEGAHYQATGWYRPKLDCIMQSPWTPEFCEICREATVLALYRVVRPVEALIPTTNSLTITGTAPVEFNLRLLQPATHSWSVQWFTNDVPVPNATNLSFSCPPQTLEPGTNRVSAVTKDATPLVRTDPTELLAEKVTWSLLVERSYLQLDSPLWLGNGNFAFRITGSAPQGFVIQATTNLVEWASLSTNVLSGGQFWFTNSRATTPGSFYRAKTPP